MTNEDIKVILVDTNKVKPYNRNARKNDETVMKLCDIIQKVGFNQPILVDKNYVIVKGHARWKAAVKLGMDKIPVIISTNDDETNKLDRLADNKIAEFSQWDDELLKTELASINLPDLDISDFGFDFDFASFSENNNAPSAPVYAPVDVPYQNGDNYTPAPAYQPSAPAYSAPAPDNDYITENDIQKTVPNKSSEYGHVMCPNCGTTVLYKK